MIWDAMFAAANGWALLMWLVLRRPPGLVVWIAVALAFIGT